MKAMSVAEVGRRLVKAGRLSTRPLCVYGSSTIEPTWVAAGKVDHCLVKVFLKQALGNLPPVYVGKDRTIGCCPGGVIHLGYAEAAEGLKYFISSGSPTYRGGAAEFLRRTPEMVEETNRVAGRIKPIAKNTVFRPCSELEKKDPGVVCVMCFGKAEQIRNICSLNQFSTTDVFGSIIVPSGSACSTLVTYPSGMAANAPREAMYVGPTDPTANRYIPPDFMGVGIPIAVARRMCEPIEESFVVKRPEVAYPEKREPLE